MQCNDNEKQDSEVISNLNTNKESLYNNYKGYLEIQPKSNVESHTAIIDPYLESHLKEFTSIADEHIMVIDSDNDIDKKPEGAVLADATHSTQLSEDGINATVEKSKSKNKKTDKSKTKKHPLIELSTITKHYKKKGEADNNKKKAIPNEQKSVNTELFSDEECFKKLEDSLTQIKSLKSSYLEVSSNAIKIGKNSEIDSSKRNDLKESLESFIPWKKGPFDIFGFVFNN